MYARIWEFHVKPGKEAEFEELYGPDGRWTRLFRTHSGFVGTELLVDEGSLNRYLTLDRWASEADYLDFESGRGEEWFRVDAAGEDLTSEESFLGGFEIS